MAASYLMTEWVCRGNPFGFRAETRSKKPILKNGRRVNDEQTHAPGEDKPHQISRTTESEKLQTVKEDEWNTTRELPRDVPSLPKSSWQASRRIQRTIMGTDRDSGKRSSLGTTGRTTALEEPCPQCSFIRSSLAFFHKRLTLPYPDGEIFSGYEEDVSSMRDSFSAMGENGPRDHSQASHLSMRRVPIQRSREAPARETLSILPQNITLTATCPTD